MELLLDVSFKELNRVDVLSNKLPKKAHTYTHKNTQQIQKDETLGSVLKSIHKPNTLVEIVLNRTRCDIKKYDIAHRRTSSMERSLIMDKHLHYTCWGINISFCQQQKNTSMLKPNNTIQQSVHIYVCGCGGGGRFGA